MLYDIVEESESSAIGSKTNEPRQETLSKN